MELSIQWSIFTERLLREKSKNVPAETCCGIADSRVKVIQVGVKTVPPSFQFLLGLVKPETPKSTWMFSQFQSSVRQSHLSLVRRCQRQGSRKHFSQFSNLCLSSPTHILPVLADAPNPRVLCWSGTILWATQHTSDWLSCQQLNSNNLLLLKMSRCLICTKQIPNHVPTLIIRERAPTSEFALKNNIQFS